MSRPVYTLWAIGRRFFTRTLFGQGLHTETRPAARKSIFLRHLDGGSSNAPEVELTALNNPIYDIEQYGIRFVASPRHADVLLITGPLTWNMLASAIAAFEAMPEPKRIVTVGDCADFLNGVAPCLFADSYAVVDLPSSMKECIVAHVPGDPPSPEAVLEVLLRLDTA